MSESKQSFIEAIECAIENGTIKLSAEASEFFETLKTDDNQITKKGMEILSWLYKNAVGKSVTAKQIAEGIQSSSRSVSGAMRKLVTNGYVIKEGKDPVMYTIDGTKYFDFN